MRQGEYDVEVGNAEEFFLSCGEPALASLCLALRTVPVPTRNGEISITCLMGSNSLWGVGRPLSDRSELFELVWL